MSPLSEDVNKRDVCFFPLLLKRVVLETYRQLILGIFEWRSDNTLAELRVRQIEVALFAPQTWSDWVEALTVIFAPSNRLSNLCREITTVKNGGTEDLGESVEQYALYISSIFIRLLAESKRTAPSNQSPQLFVWKRLKIAVFENGLLPSIIFE